MWVFIHFLSFSPWIHLVQIKRRWWQLKKARKSTQTSGLFMVDFDHWQEQVLPLQPHLLPCPALTSPLQQMYTLTYTGMHTQTYTCPCAAPNLELYSSSPLDLKWSFWPCFFNQSQTNLLPNFYSSFVRNSLPPGSSPWPIYPTPKWVRTSQSWKLPL